MCDCNKKTCSNNDYSIATSKTGIAQVSSANPNLDGSGNISQVIMAGKNGAIIKSVRIKAIIPVSQGMIRLFLKDTISQTTVLYKEIPISTTPHLESTPTPMPILPTFELALGGGLKLENGFALMASTQNAQTFNIIAETLEWEYPAQLPSVCCNFKQESAITGLGIANTANSALDGTGAIVKILSVSNPNGAFVKHITIKALSSTNEGMIRLFVSPDGISYYLYREIMIPLTTQSSFEASYKQVLEENIYLEDGFALGVSTELSQSFGVTVEGVALSYPI
jgi:hypothetical protein